LKGSKGRFLLGDILPIASEVLEKLRNFPEVERADTAGSVRRRRETIGDVDILAIPATPARSWTFSCRSPGGQGLGQGGTKSSVHLKEGFDMDLRVIAPESYGAASSTSPAPRTTILR